MPSRHASNRDTLVHKWLLSALKGRAASERRVALKPCVSLMGEIPRHPTAYTVSCKQLSTVTARATCLSKVASFAPTFST